MEFQTVKWSVHPNPLRPGEKCIGLVTLSVPKRLNAVGPQMDLELDCLFDQIKWRDEIKVVVMTGTDPGFCSGGDLKDEGGPLQVTGEGLGITGPYRYLLEYFFNDILHVVMQRALRKLENLPQVTIAAINGIAVGVGLEMCTLCDIRIASERARMGEVAVAAGFLPECGGARNLPKLVGIGRAMEMTLTGRMVEAKEALEMGLVEFVVPHENLLEEAFQLAGRIALNPYLSVRQAKRLLKKYWDWNKTDEGFRDELESVLEITRTPDCREGIRAFVERRRPNYTGPRFLDSAE